MAQRKKFTFEDEVENKSNNKLNNPKKKKRKLKRWILIIGVIVALLLGSLIISSISSGNEREPVYGNRCASLLTVDKNKYQGVIQTVTAKKQITDMKIRVECRLIKISLTFAPTIKADLAQKLAVNALHVFDDSQGQTKTGVWSSLLSKNGDKQQYNVEIILESSGNLPGFPMFGTKHPMYDEISFSTTKPVDQATTDAIKAKNTGN